VQDSDVDALVDLIAHRVRARLSAGELPGPSAFPPVPGKPDPLSPCKDDTGCNACGLCATRRTDDVRTLMVEGAARVGAKIGIGRPPKSIAQIIDHTILNPDATKDDLKRVCEEARTYGFATVCVNSSNVGYVARLLEGSGVLAIAVVGFPLGAALPKAKAFEAREAIRAGAREIDMVINIGAMKSKDYALVLEDICAVTEASKPWPVKVILETSALTDEEKIIGCSLAKAGGAAFVKTSTGFGKGGATPEDIALMRRIVGPELGVKASGGVRTREDVDKMVAAGATRIGASASVAIVSGKNPGAGKY